MKARQLYKAAEYLGTTLAWENDWTHFGTGDEVDFKLVDGLIEDFLLSDTINFIQERTNSEAFDRSRVSSIIKEMLGRANFELWSEPMERAIQFKRIGVLRKGIKNALRNT